MDLTSFVRINGMFGWKKERDRVKESKVELVKNKLILC